MANERPSRLRAQALRYAFLFGWFAIVPIALAGLTVYLLRSAYEPGPKSFVLLRFVAEQSVPAFIVFFTVFEMVIYNRRHSLPLARLQHLGGREDVPPEFRRELDHAGQLLDEAARLRRAHAKELERLVKKPARDELDAALEDLQGVVEDEPFDAARFGDAFEKAAHLVDRHLGRWRKSELREYLESILVAVAVALALRAVVVEAFKIPSGSMLPTLQIQDHIFVNKLAYGPTIPWTHTRVLTDMPPERGDVIVFEFPYPIPGQSAEDYIKRVIGLPGDTLMVEDGQPVINGWPVPRCQVGRYDYSDGDPDHLRQGTLFVEFLGDEAYLTLFQDELMNGREGPFHVPDGQVFVFGDNRNNSSDSRAWHGRRGAGVPFANIKGRAMFVWLSFASGGFTMDRIGLSVMGRPTLPSTDPEELASAIDRCMATRPPLDQTTPPAPRSAPRADFGR